ncbi:MAG: hypothetical protein HP491_10270 [Nitrospira sp.]|nr:hypothetical protein [Nitrospira sp.]MBH0183228.1 hypothetical protein [Nitrospira sp.]MBH0186102.1 hypothetical protein [Nitrospira sp.]
MGLTSILPSFPPMLPGHTIGPIQASQFAAGIGPAIVLAIHLPILAPVSLPVFPAILPPVELTVLSSIFPSVKLPVCTAIHPTIFTSIFLPHIDGLGIQVITASMTSATVAIVITATIHRTWSAIQRARPSVVHAYRRLFHRAAHLSYRRRRQ